MIGLGVHFECGWEASLITEDYTPTFYLLRVDRSSGESIDLFFPTRETRDAVRDALIQCPGCVARPEGKTVEPSTADEPTTPTIEGVPITKDGVDRFIANERAFNGMVANAVFGTPLPQPAVQAMDAVEDWEMPF